MSAHQNASLAVDKAPKKNARKRKLKAPKKNARKGELKSEVWKEFEMDFDRMIATCKHCLGEFKHNPKDGTTHLKNHLNICPYRESTNDILLVKAMVQLGCRYDMVSNSLFQRYIRSLCPGYNLSSKDRMGELLEKIFSDEQDKLDQVCKGLSSCISFSISYQKPHLYITAYYIDSNWKLQQKILGLIDLNPNDDDDSFRHKLYYVLMRQNSPLNIITMNDEAVTSTSRIITKWFDDDRKSIPMDECSFGASALNYYNFRVKCAIQVIDEVAEKGTSLYKKMAPNFQGSWKRALGDIQNSIGRTNKEQTRLSVLRNCWGCFDEASKSMTIWNYVPGSVFFVQICGMLSFLEDQHIYMDEEIKVMIEEMKSILNGYWDSHKILLSVASFLDPRYKMAEVKKNYHRIFPNDGQYANFNAVISNLMNLYVRMEGSSDFLSKECELEQYLSEECLSNACNEHLVLGWWGYQKLTILKRMAKDILGIPFVSTAKAWHVDNFIQQEMYRERFRDPCSHLTSEMKLCLYDWLQNEYQVDTARWRIQIEMMPRSDHESGYQ